uniref:UDP-glycosyltransferase 73C2-like n=1 Tax=Nicotiana tabacum TaxID=4097 RepID=A0A1S3XLK2_TOBAC|nr:PREDICTED: UDP-glycosyltransferase 73C2-like [Nicotiana tabacum]
MKFQFRGTGAELGRRNVIDRAIGSGLLIRVLELQFPAKEAGLPEGCESADVLPALAFQRNLFAAIDILQDQAEKLLEEIKPKPSCIICDTHIAWIAETADKFQIPRIIFDGMRTLCIQDIRNKIRTTEERAYGVVINTFEELEQRYVDKIRRLKDGRVWCIGPLSLCNNDNLDKSQRGNKASFHKEDKDSLIKWLDSWPPESVVYACLGSLGRITVVQFVELALGLEASGYPFILVIKAGEGQEPIDDWISKNGFEKRTKERGLLIQGWAPQVLILSHPSIGGFLTHCCWNSTLEGIAAGVPVITWPLFSEQFLNERYLVHVLKMGVSVGSQGVMHLGEEENPEVQVNKEEVTKAIKKVTAKEKEINDWRKRAKELQKRQ